MYVLSGDVGEWWGADKPGGRRERERKMKKVKEGGLVKRQHCGAGEGG